MDRISELEKQLEQEREKVKIAEGYRKDAVERAQHNANKAQEYQLQLSQLQALVRALPDCPGEIKVYPPAVRVICGTYDVRYDFHFESGGFQSIRLAMFHDECEANTYADLLKYRATLDATPPARGEDTCQLCKKSNDGQTINGVPVCPTCHEGYTREGGDGE